MKFIKNLCIFLIVTCFAIETPALNLKKVHWKITPSLDLFDIPGAAIAIVHRGKIFFCEPYGYRNKEKRLPMTLNTLFPLCSLTKAFTSFVMGQLVDEGKVNWDDPVIRYLPEFKLWDRYRTETMTIRDLLAHRSGIPRHDHLWYRFSLDSESQMLDCFPFLEPLYNLREKFTYSNLMYAVAGLVIERITGNSWQEEVRQRIFDPLEMTHSHFGGAALSSSKDHALPYATRFGKLQTVPILDLSVLEAAGSINTNIRDFANWMLMHVSGGSFKNNPLISRSTLEEMQTVQIEIEPPKRNKLHHETQGYGLGWMIGQFRGYPLISHGGFSRGYSSQIAFIPALKMGVAIFTNQDFPKGRFSTHAIQNTILDHLLGDLDNDWGTIKWEESVQYGKFLEEEREQKLSQIKPGKPAHSLEWYVGQYENEGHGVIEISIKDKKLFARYYALETPLNHLQDDHFEASFDVIDPIIAGTDFIFKEGTLQVNIEPELPPITFELKSDEK